MSSFSKIASSAVVAASLVAGQAVTFASDAQARDGRRDGAHRSYSPAPRHYEPRHTYHAPRHHVPHRRDRSGDAVAGAILGIGALIVGAAIADAHRNKRTHDDRYDD